MSDINVKRKKRNSGIFCGEKDFVMLEMCEMWPRTKTRKKKGVHAHLVCEQRERQLKENWI